MTKDLPLVAYQDNGKLVLLSGWKRLAEAKGKPLKEFSVYVVDNPNLDYLLGLLGR